MTDWLKNLASQIPGWVPQCVIDLVRKGMGSLLHAAAILFGLVFCGLSTWDVVVAKQAFAHIAFGTGAAAIMGAWGTLWLVLKNMQASAPIPPAAS